MVLLTKQSKNRGLRPRTDDFYPFERAFNRLYNDVWLNPWRHMETMAGMYLPLVNVRESDGCVYAEAELPGMSEKDIEVVVTRDTLRISGEKKREEETKEDDYTYQESTYGTFNRVIDLPAEVDEQKAEARFKNGVLTITLPKSDEGKAKTKKLTVTSE